MAKANATAKHAAVYPSHLQQPTCETSGRPPISSGASSSHERADYRLYLIGAGIEAGGVEQIAAGSDDDAIAAARALVEAPSARHWSGFTLIGPMARVVSTWRR